MLGVLAGHPDATLLTVRVVDDRRMQCLCECYRYQQGECGYAYKCLHYYLYGRPWPLLLLIRKARLDQNSDPVVLPAEVLVAVVHPSA